MRIGTKLILGFVAVLGLVGGALSVGMRSLTQGILVHQTEKLMEQQVETVAARLGQTPREMIQARSTAALLDTDLFVSDRNLETGLLISKDGRVRTGVGTLMSEDMLQFLSQTMAAGHTQTTVFPLHGTAQARQLERSEAHSLIAAAAPLVRGGQVLGVVMLARPVEEATRALLTVSAQILFWTLLGLILAAWLSFLVARTLTRRIGQVSRAANAMAEGDLSHRVPEESNDEIGHLARAFNHMAGRVEALVVSLKHSETLRRDLMASIAHELRTPTTSIRGFAEALKDGVVPDHRRARTYEIIHGEAERLTRLIEDLFDLAKLEAGQLEMRMQPMDLTHWLQEFVRTQRDQLERSGVGLEIQVPGQTPVPILADQDRLEQVLQNLIDNAARYSPAGAAVAVSLDLVPAAARVSVRDYGPGVPAAEAEHLWEPYYQGQDSGRRKGGAGLGLAIVRSIVTAHGGQVGLDSVPGQGACFWFTLPLSPGPAGETAGSLV